MTARGLWQSSVSDRSVRELCLCSSPRPAATSCNTCLEKNSQTQKPIVQQNHPFVSETVFLLYLCSVYSLKVFLSTSSEYACCSAWLLLPIALIDHPMPTSVQGRVSSHCGQLLSFLFGDISLFSAFKRLCKSFFRDPGILRRVPASHRLKLLVACLAVVAGNSLSTVTSC